nr:MAG TPA: hypothetical protein [Caudoviricetes sp.]
MEAELAFWLRSICFKVSRAGTILTDLTGNEFPVNRVAGSEGNNTGQRIIFHFW